MLVDGNGILHVRRFGLVSHLGVITDIPTIGVGKKVFVVDGVTLNNIIIIEKLIMKEIAAI